MSSTAVLRADGFELSLRVSRYERAAAPPSHYEDWLVAEVNASINRAEGPACSYRASQSISMVTADAARFVAGLEQLDRDLSGEAALTTLESNLDVTVSA